MAKRLSLSKSEQATPAGAELVALCLRVTEQGRLTEEGIREVIRWLKENRAADLPAKDYLTQTMARIVADRTIASEELRELHAAIESILPSSSRKIVAQRRKDRASARKQQAKAAKAAEKLRKQQERERALAESEVVLLTASNGRKYQLHSLVGEVEYGRETLETMAARLGQEVAAIVAQHVSARERQFAGHVIRETEGGAWLFRLVQGGDCVVPIQGARIVSGSFPGPLVIAVSPSLAADIDRQTATPRNLLEFTTAEVAQRFNVSVDTVRKWIRDGHLATASVGNGSAAFEYRIPGDELLRFASKFGR
jgi:excisionase family DNA binding protein